MRHLLVATAFFLLSVVACGSDTVGTGDHPTGGIRVLLTDSPFPYDQVKRVDVYVVRVAAGADSVGTRTIAEPKRRFNVLALQRGTTALLGTGSLPDASYAAVWVTINSDSSSMTLKDGTVLRYNTDPGIVWSGNGERVILADMFKPIEVVDTSATFVIHFDVARSFIPLPDVVPPGPEGWYGYVPAVDALDPTEAGAISGTVVSGQGTPRPVPDAPIRAMVGNPLGDPGAWFVAATGATDAEGRFKLAFLPPPSAAWTGAGWVYNVEVYTPGIPGKDPQRFTSVTVIAGEETALGTISLP